LEGSSCGRASPTQNTPGEKKKSTEFTGIGRAALFGEFIRTTQKESGPGGISSWGQKTGLRGGIGTDNELAKIGEGD